MSALAITTCPVWFGWTGSGQNVPGRPILQLLLEQVVEIQEHRAVFGAHLFYDADVLGNHAEDSAFTSSSIFVDI